MINDQNLAYFSGMGAEHFHITKSTGEKVDFSMEKLKNSLQFSGASDEMVEEILSEVWNVRRTKYFLFKESDPHHT